MKKLLGLLTVLALILTAAAVVGEGAEDARITGKFEDGAYVLTVKTDPDDAGEWRADEMAQDDTVVTLAASGRANGVVTARYEPAGEENWIRFSPGNGRRRIRSSRCWTS